MNPSDGTAFEIEAQSGQNVSNVGGDQTIYFGDRSRANRIGRIVEAVGLSLCIIGIGVLVPVGVTTSHSVLHDIHTHGLQTPYTHYLSAGWAVAIGLSVVGLLVKRFARIVVGR
jgi:hypothetical protein